MTDNIKHTTDGILIQKQSVFKYPPCISRLIQTHCCSGLLNDLRQAMYEGAQRTGHRPSCKSAHCHNRFSFPTHKIVLEHAASTLHYSVPFISLDTLGHSSITSHALNPTPRLPGYFAKSLKDSSV